MSDSEGGNLFFFSGLKMRLREEGRREGFADGSSLYFGFNSFLFNSLVLILSEFKFSSFDPTFLLRPQRMVFFCVRST
jgi:hypothetical protein